MKDKIFLLSAEEAKTLPEVLLESNHWWWLRSSGFVNIIAGAVNNTKIYPDSAKYVFDNDGGVRPALRFDTHEEILNLLANNPNIRYYKNIKDLKTKSIFCIAIYKYLGEKWIDITAFVGFPCLLKKKPFKKTRRFDPDSHEYERSEIRQWLLDWYNNKKEKIDIINNKEENKEKAIVMINDSKSDLIFTDKVNTAINILDQESCDNVPDTNAVKRGMTIKIEKTETFIENNIIVAGTKIGTVELCPERKEIMKLTIFEPYQNKGYGTDVIQTLVKEGYNYLWVRSNNLRAIHVYEKCGFKKGEPKCFEMTIEEVKE